MSSLISFILILVYLSNFNILMTEGGINIKRIDELLDMTEELRKCLGELIDEKGDLLDREVIVASQMLDSVLNQYHQVISKKKMDK